MDGGKAQQRRVAGILGLAASLVITVSGTAFAGFWADLLHRDRAAATPQKCAPTSTTAVADNSTNCGKCHSWCESGRSHEGLTPTATMTGSKLPLTADGRTTCTTCHNPHDKGGVVTGASLRMPNVRRELCLACHRQESVDNPRIEIVSPLERAIVQEERVALIGRAQRLAGAQLTVRINGAVFHLHVKDGEFNTWLTLQDGFNSIEIARDERLLWKGEIFRGQNAVNGYERSFSGHLTDNWEQCQGCHKQGDASAKVGQSPSLCFACHDRNNDKRYVHGPLAVGDCLTCHDPHGGYGSAHLRKEQTSLCGSCHAARESSATAACLTAGKGCVDCHDPHQSDMKYLLKGPQYTMREVPAELR